jgi:hypothetical protein
MSVDQGLRTVVVVGARRRSALAGTLDRLGAGDELLLLVLGLEPSRWQREVVDRALGLASERRFPLTAELVPGRERLLQLLAGDDRLRVFAGRRELRRFALRVPPSDLAP